MDACVGFREDDDENKAMFCNINVTNNVRTLHRICTLYISSRQIYINKKGKYSEYLK